MTANSDTEPEWGSVASMLASPLRLWLQISRRPPRDAASGTRRQPSAKCTCKASRMSLSEISVAKDLVPEVLKVAWMMLFLSLSSCEQREGAGESPPRLEAFQKVDVPSLFTAAEAGRGRRGRLVCP